MSEFGQVLIGALALMGGASLLGAWLSGAVPRFPPRTEAGLLIYRDEDPGFFRFQMIVWSGWFVFVLGFLSLILW